jgi:hypothetical protein
MYYLANKNVEFWEFQSLVGVNHESFTMTSIIDHAISHNHLAFEFGRNKHVWAKQQNV